MKDLHVKIYLKNGNIIEKHLKGQYTQFSIDNILKDFKYSCYKPREITSFKFENLCVRADDIAAIDMNIID